MATLEVTEVLSETTLNDIEWVKHSDIFSFF